MFRHIYLSSNGRCSRRFYWQFFVIPSVVIGILIAVVALLLRPHDLFYVFVGLLLVWPTAVIYIKRWHDIGRSGWLALLNFVPIVGLILWIVLGFIPGTPGTNKYGPDPTEPRRAAGHGVSAQ